MASLRDVVLPVVIVIGVQTATIYSRTPPYCYISRALHKIQSNGPIRIVFDWLTDEGDVASRPSSSCTQKRVCCVGLYTGHLPEKKEVARLTPASNADCGRVDWTHHKVHEICSSSGTSLTALKVGPYQTLKRWHCCLHTNLLIQLITSLEKARNVPTF